MLRMAQQEFRDIKAALAERAANKSAIRWREKKRGLRVEIWRGSETRWPGAISDQDRRYNCVVRVGNLKRQEIRKGWPLAELTSPGQNRH